MATKKVVAMLEVWYNWLGKVIQESMAEGIREEMYTTKEMERCGE